MFGEGNGLIVNGKISLDAFSIIISSQQLVNMTKDASSYNFKSKKVILYKRLNNSSKL